EGVFQHPCILNTFTFYLESVGNLPLRRQQDTHGQWPKSVLSLTTMAVERAFGQWATGHFVALDARQFSQQAWGFAMNEIMNSVDKVSEQKWKKIYSGAEEYLWAYHPKSKAALCAKSRNKSSGRAHCYEPDSE
ncbi:hypothetical protein SCLCIDRAFT_126134, partial [Scleroderma citrinum Foug A]